VILFVDTETLGLDPDLHAIWEVAAILYNPETDKVEDTQVWQLGLTSEQMAQADPVALDICQFEKRRADSIMHTDPFEFAVEFAALASGYHLAGAVVSFDEERLRRLLAQHGVDHTWHYHLIDVEALAIGYLNAREDPPDAATRLPWKSDSLSWALGVEPDEAGRHTAMGDAKWALAIYRAVMG
jgi:oligoribonuclease (3'-5' exoribonuclease)